MKKFNRILTYVITALLSATLTLTLVVPRVAGSSKLDQVEALLLSNFIGEADSTAMEDAAASAMVYSLGDRWSYYLNAEEYAAHQEESANAYVGIGVTIQPMADGTGFQVISVQENGSAMQAGVQLGDIIISADGQRVEGMTTTQLRGIIRGKEGTTIRLGLLRNGQELEVEIVRANILVDVVTSRMLEDGIGLITIANFDSRCASESIAAIESLQEAGARALIFDVRNNPGGYAHELVELLDYLLPEGDLFRTVDYTGKEDVDRSDAAFLDMPMAVLCNGESYSAAEFFAAAIQEYGAGTVVGSPTCGKGYFQYTYAFNDGSAIGLSVGKYFTPNGVSLAGVGITPDVLVEVDNDTAMAILSGSLEPEDDPQIQAAMEVLSE